MTLGDVWDQLSTDVIIGIVDLIKTLIVGLLDFASSGLTSLRNFANQEIQVPIFSTLYKDFISGGTPLTLPDAVALLLAIPSTALYRAVTGETPPDLTRLDYSDLLNEDQQPANNETLRQNWFCGTFQIVALTFVNLSAQVDVIVSEFELVDAVALARFRAPHPLRAQAAALAAKASTGSVILRVLSDWHTWMGLGERAFTIPCGPFVEAKGAAYFWLDLV